MEIEKLIERLDGWDGGEAIYNGEYVEVKYHGVFRLLEEAAAALEQLQAENEKLKAQVPRWIPVEEGLPEENVTVLAFNTDSHAERYVLARYRNVNYLGCFWYQLDQEYVSWTNPCWGVTHWMPLPQPPKEETYEK